MGARQLRAASLPAGAFVASRRSWRLTVVVLAAAVAAGALGAVALRATPSASPPLPAAGATSVGLPLADVAVQAQRLQVALQGYATQAAGMTSTADVRAHTIQLQQQEEALGALALASAQLVRTERVRAAAADGAGARAEALLAADRATTVGRLATDLRARAVATRLAAQAGGDEAASIGALRSLAADVARRSARLGSLVDRLGTATDARAYAAVLTAIAAEIGRDPGAFGGAPAEPLTGSLDDPVAAS